MAISEEYEQDFKNTESSELTSKVPPYELDREIQDKKVMNRGAPTLPLRNFIDDLLIKVKPNGDSTPLPMFYALVEEYGLIIYDKPLDRIKEGKIISPRKIIPSIELLGTLRLREQQADKSFDDDSFQFWETLAKESRYAVFRDDVAMAYDCAGKSQFPWLNMDNAPVWLSVGEHTLENVKSEANQKDENEKPWLIADPADPFPEQPWYISARYFARQLVKDDSTLLTKRSLLAVKVVQSLTSVNIKKRGGEKPFDSGTVLKALSKVTLG